MPSPRIGRCSLVTVTLGAIRSMQSSLTKRINTRWLGSSPRRRISKTLQPTNCRVFMRYIYGIDRITASVACRQNIPRH